MEVVSFDEKTKEEEGSAEDHFKDALSTSNQQICMATHNILDVEHDLTKTSQVLHQEGQPDEKLASMVRDVHQKNDKNLNIHSTVKGFEPKKSLMNTYYVYKIKTKTDIPSYGTEGSYEVERRYSDFINLYFQLYTKFPDCVIPIPPPKSYEMFRGNGYLEEDRTIWLQVFLDLILLDWDLCMSNEVIKFLTVKKELSLSMTLNAKNLLVKKFGNFTEKLQSARYGDVESDSFYLTLKSQITKLDESIRLIAKMNFSSLLIDLSKNLVSVGEGLQDMTMSLNENRSQYGTDNAFNTLQKLLRIYQCLSTQLHINEVTAYQHDNDSFKTESHSVLFSRFIVQLGACKMMIDTFKIAFTDREKRFRPIIDLDSHFKDIQINTSTSNVNEKKGEKHFNDRTNYQQQAVIFESDEDKQSQIQLQRINFKKYSENQKIILKKMHEYLCNFLHSSIKNHLVSVLDIEKKHLAQLYDIKSY